MLDLNKQLKSAEQSEREDDLFGSAEDFSEEEEHEELAAENVSLQEEDVEAAAETAAVSGIERPRTSRRRRRTRLRIWALPNFLLTVMPTRLVSVRFFRA